MRDEFDDASLHLVLRIGEEPAAAMRITHPPARVFRTWTSGAAQLPEDPDAADLSRLCVSPRLPGLALSRLLAARGLLETGNLGYRTANGAFADQNSLQAYVIQFGAVPAGPRVTSREPNHPPIDISPVTFDTAANRERWLALIERDRTRLAERGFQYLEKAPEAS